MKKALSKWLARIKRLRHYMGIRSRNRQHLPVALPLSYIERLARHSCPYHFVCDSLPLRKTDTRPFCEINLILRDCGPPRVFEHVIDVIKAF